MYTRMELEIEYKQPKTQTIPLANLNPHNKEMTITKADENLDDSLGQAKTAAG